MFKLILHTAFFSFIAFASYAQMPYLDEVKALGSVSGQGLACGSSKYDTFEMLARAILLSKAPSDSEQSKAMYEYSEAKANAYMSKQFDGFYNCPEINQRFEQQGIFNAVLYADGTIKMPDGSIITPRRPYDASLIYKKNNKIKEELQAIYNGSKDVKVGEIKIKPTGNEGDIQTVYRPGDGTAKANSHITDVNGIKDVKPIPDVSSQSETLNNSVGHIKSKW